MLCFLDLGGKPEDEGLSLEGSAIPLKASFEGISPRRTSPRFVKTQDESLSEVSEIRIGESDVLGTVTVHLSPMGIIRVRAYICIHMHTYAHTCIRLPTRFALVRVRACMHEFVHTYAYICTYMSTATQQIRPLSLSRYGVATVSRLIKITCLFCKRAL